MKAKQLFAIGTLLVSMLLFTACDPKEQAFNDLQEFTLNLEQNNQSFTEIQWEQSLVQYNEICQSIAEYEAEYTPTEIETIGRLKGRCRVIFTRHAVEDGVDGFIRDLYQYKGMFEGMMEGLNGALEKYQ